MFLHFVITICLLKIIEESMTVRITKRLVDAAEPGGKDCYLWDNELTGFGVKITPAGRKVYLVQYRIGGRKGRTRRVTIGPHGTVTTDKARNEARRLLGLVAGGIDPALEKDNIRGGLTVSQALNRFLDEHVVAKRKSRTADEYRRIVSSYIAPRFGSRLLREIAHADVAKLHRDMADKPYAANRTVAVLSKFFNWCEQNGLRPDQTNPCRHIEKYKEEKRERYLSPDEFKNLGEVLDAFEKDDDGSPFVAAAIRLLIFTGARLNEMLTLRWEQVDQGRQLLFLADSKTGKKTIQLNQATLDILSALPRLDGNPYVICGQKAGHHLVNLGKPWRAIRHEAGLDDVRLHDLRHSFGAVAAGSGLSLPIIGGLLGHSQPQTTARYAHLANNPLRTANDAIGQAIADAMESGDGSSSGQEHKTGSDT